MKQILFLTILLVNIAGSNGCQPAPVRTANASVNDNYLSLNNSAEGPILDEEYKIYSELIDQNYPTDEGIISITEKTTYGSVAPNSTFDEVRAVLKKEFPASLPNEILEDFLSKNKEIWKLSEKFLISRNYRIMAAPDPSESSKGILVSFSRVGFNKEKDIALLYIEDQGDAKSGYGEYIILKKKEGKWQRQKEYKLPKWIS